MAREVPCTRCRAPIALGDDVWRRILAHAHAIADLHGAAPEGRARSLVAVDAINPFAADAQERSGVWADPSDDPSMTRWLPASVRMWASSGRPIGPETLEPLEIVSIGAGELHAAAPSRNDDDARYTVDAEMVALHDGFAGAVGEEHRSDRPGPTLSVDAGAAEAPCPSCGVPLAIDGALPRVRCGACGTVSHVPAAVRHARQPGSGPGLWWLVFSGPSPLRRALERADGEVRPDDRTIEPLPIADGQPIHRLANLSLMVAVPLTALLLAGGLMRALGVASWLAGWLQGS
ncbi:MAG: hypothetical protein AAF211_21445 [Myxococcota bacterium]